MWRTATSKEQPAWALLALSLCRAPLHAPAETAFPDARRREAAYQRLGGGDPKVASLRPSSPRRRGPDGPAGLCPLLGGAAAQRPRPTDLLEPQGEQKPRQSSLLYLLFYFCRLFS